MAGRIESRLDDILDALEQLERLAAAHDVDSLAADKIARAAFERLLRSSARHHGTFRKT